jgi:hypothetical protein
MPIGRGALAILGSALVFMLALGALVGCGGGSDQESAQEVVGNEPGQEEPAGKTASTANVVLRISGTPGTVYSGNYGTPTETRTVPNATLEADPTDYPVEVEDESGALNASFKKTQPGREVLTVEILVDGESVTRSETSAELGSAIVNWVPPGVALELTTLPKEFEKK